MCLLLDHGLRVGEIAILKRNQIVLRSRLLTFCRPKVDEPQIDRLSNDSYEAARTYLPTLPGNKNHSSTWLLSAFRHSHDVYMYEFFSREDTCLMPLEFEDVGTVSFPVTGIDDLAVTRIQADGGSVNRQTEVCFISLPPGTQRKRLVSEPEPGHIIHKQSNRPLPDMLYKLPSGCVLRLSEHYLSYVGDGDEESEV